MRCKTCERLGGRRRSKCADCGLKLCRHTGNPWGGGWSEQRSEHLCGTCCRARHARDGWATVRGAS